MPLTKLTSLGITDGTIVNADINASAAIAASKLSGSLGKVLQVVTSSTNTQQTTTSSSFVDATSLSVSITPSSTSNKIFIICTTNGYSGNTSANSEYTILRGATNLATNFFNYVVGTDIAGQISMVVLDSPNTTSSTTYKAQFRRSSASGTAYVQVGSSFGQITAFEIAG